MQPLCTKPCRFIVHVLTCIYSQSPAWSEGNRGHSGRRDTLQTEVSLETSRELDWICLTLKGISCSQTTTPSLVGEVWSKEDLCFYTLEVEDIKQGV